MGAERAAERLDFTISDNDEMIYDSDGCPLSEIVMQLGWQYFRKLERNVLKKCGLLKNVVVATVGGAVLHEDIWTEIKPDLIIDTASLDRAQIVTDIVSDITFTSTDEAVYKLSSATSGQSHGQLKDEEEAVSQ